MRKLNSQSGFSLVESLVAMALMLGVGLLLTYFSTNRLAQVSNQQQSACMLHARTTLDKIRGLGGVKAIGRLDVQSNRITRPITAENTVNYIRPVDEWLSTGDPVYRQRTPNGRVILKTEKAIVGSMAMLSSLYESSPAFCGNARGSTYTVNAPQELLESGDFAHLKNVSSTLRIQPYSTITGATLSCIRPLIVIPPGNLGRIPARDANMTILDPGTRNDVGFLVTVHTNYEDLKGRNESCSFAAQFSYPNVSVNPDTLEDLSVQFTRSSVTTSIDGAAQFSVCESTVPMVRLTISTSDSEYATKKGMVMLCRDTSSFAPSTPTTACSGQPTIRRNFNAINRWVPCKDLRICGQAAVNAASSENANGYILDYHGINIGCVASAEVRMVDLAQNIAASAETGLLTAAARVGCRSSCPLGSFPRIPGRGGSCAVRVPAGDCDSSTPGGGDPTDGGDGTDGASDGGDTDGKSDDGGDPY